MQKLLNEQNLAKTLNEIRESGKKIVLTNGCFDILHVGHIRYLKEAKNQGDILIIGLNSDTSVKALKGENRPINNEHDRAEILSSLYFVDFIIIFSEPTADNLLMAVKPDYYVKGGDYNLENLPEALTIQKIGAQAVFIHFIEGYSTTEIIARSSNK